MYIRALNILLKLGCMAVSSKYPSLGDCEILVVEGGPAGIGAALGAARQGANVLLIENQGFFGGARALSIDLEERNEERRLSLVAFKGFSILSG